MYNYEEVFAGTSFRSARSFFDTFDDIDSSDVDTDLYYLEMEMYSPEQTRKRKRYKTWKREQPDTESDESEPDAPKFNAEEQKAIPFDLSQLE